MKIQDNVYDWLCYIGLDEYTEQFTRCHITITDDLEQLTSFTRKDIEAELKITKPGTSYIIAVSNHVEQSQGL